MKRTSVRTTFAVALGGMATAALGLAADPPSSPTPLQISGVYPSLTMWNDENECGTGAVVPWQGSLWAVTYAPHQPGGSTDRLYEITNDLQQRIFEGSVGGTPANRMIHPESNQLLIGPYLIGPDRRIRTLPPRKMFGRLTANARHLTDPANKIYYATMEEGLYEVDVRSLEVTCLLRDGNRGAPATGALSTLPGYHGKGMYASQGRLVYANNGERDPRVTTDPTIPSGALAQWFGEGDWQMVRRAQFTEVMGPGGLTGNAAPDTDPVWSLGWDARSLLLALLEEGQWSYYRLPKGSHSYDGAHGWNTEWPRIRAIGEEDWLATMHGTFWRFPPTFSRRNSAGIAPRSNYLKVVGDFCQWQDHLVLGCDDSARAEFLNTRTFKAEQGAPKQSNSNLWFIAPETLDRLGPALGRGSVWLREDLSAGQTSDPYLFSGYDHRQLVLTHRSDNEITFLLEVDPQGTNAWQPLRTLTVPPQGTLFYRFPASDTGAWIRLTSRQDAAHVTAHFHYRDRDPREATHHGMFAGLATKNQPAERFGLMRSLAYNRLGVAAATRPDGSDARFYTLHPDMTFTASDAPEATDTLIAEVTQPPAAFRIDAASVIMEEDGKRYRLPRSLAADPPLPEAISAFGRARVCREVATERDLLNVDGTFYELPARNAQGLAKIRPVATHHLTLHDFCSHNGLLFFTGLDAHTEGPHIFRSADGQAAVWAGVVDDLWKLGKPRGHGGPWRNTGVLAGQPSDPYLMTGYEHKTVRFRSTTTAKVTLEIDIDGTGLWVPYQSFHLQPEREQSHRFPEGFSAYWVRATSDRDTRATVQFEYQ